MVIDDATFGGYSDENGKRVWSTASALLVGGDPMVFQIHMTGDAKPATAPEAYVYSGLTPAKLDAQGRPALPLGMEWIDDDAPAPAKASCRSSWPSCSICCRD